MQPSVIRLTPADVARYARLRLRMLTEAPWAFAACPDDDIALDRKQLARLLAEQHNAILAIEADGKPSANRGRAKTLLGHPEVGLIAAAGIRRETRAKFSHRAKVWGVFVEPDCRGKGLGKTVLNAAIDLGRTWSGVDYIDLGVSENAPHAQRLYESLGFTVWGREPAATQHNGRRYDEFHMTLRL